MTDTIHTGNSTAGILDRVTVDLAGLTVVVDDERVTAGSIPELRNTLSGLLYRRMHCGSAAGRSPVHVRNPRLERALRARLVDRPHGVRIPEREAVHAPEGDLVVQLDGVRVRFDPSRWRQADDDTVEVRISRLRPMFSPGFFVIGTGEVPGPIRRVYVRAEAPADALEVFASLVELLDAHGAYRAKMLTVESQYPRNDAIVVYLPHPSDELLQRIVDVVEGTGLVPDRTTPFAERIGRGVSTADDPPPAVGGSPRSFGEHRADAFARALVEAHREGFDVAAHLADVLRSSGIDPDRPSRNLAPQGLPSAPITRGEVTN